MVRRAVGPGQVRRLVDEIERRGDHIVIGARPEPAQHDGRDALAVPEARELHHALEARPRAAQQHRDDRGGDDRGPELLEHGGEARERPVGAFRDRVREQVERLARIDADQRQRGGERGDRLALVRELLQPRPGARLAQVPDGVDRDHAQANRAASQHPQDAIIQPVEAQQRAEPLGLVAGLPVDRVVPERDEERKIEDPDRVEAGGMGILDRVLQRAAPRLLDPAQARVPPTALRAHREDGDDQEESSGERPGGDRLREKQQRRVLLANELLVDDAAGGEQSVDAVHVFLRELLGFQREKA